MTGRSHTKSALPRQRTSPATPDAEDLLVVRPASAPDPSDPAYSSSGQRWTDHRFAAFLVRLAVLAVPVVAASACAIGLSAALPRVRGLGPALLWWAAVLGASALVLLVVDRLARRLLPLAVLLRLTLLFPDRAPSRYRLAARAGSTRRLRERLDAARDGDVDDEPAEAAARIIALVAMLAAHDRRTRGHSERVRVFNDLIAEELGLSERDRDRLRWAALIHDIGKLSVPRKLLNKPAEPTAREWAMLRSHPLRGAQIARPLAAWLGTWASAVEEHHEHWDGSGYPHGLAGTQISLGARIVAVADAFEVMTSARPYARPVSPRAAREELAACAGSHFDPLVVRAFLNISIGKLRKAMGPIAWLTQIPFLASMPRLEAAIIQGGRQVVVGAGAGAGAAALTVGGVPAADTHPHVHPGPAVVHVSDQTAATQPATQPADGDVVTSGDGRAQMTPHSRAAGQGGNGGHPARRSSRAAAGSARQQAKGPAGARPSGGAAAARGDGAPWAGAPVTPSSNAGGHHGDGNHGRGLGNGGSIWPEWLVRLGDFTPPGTATSLEHDPHQRG